MEYFRSRWVSSVKLVAWLVFAVAIALQATKDMQYSPDSMHYVDIARTFVQEGHIATYHLNLTSAEIPDRAMPWPPGYPLLLSIPLKAGCDANVAVRIISIFALLLTCVAGARLCGLLSGPGVHGVCFALLVLLCGGIEVFGFAWSEPPFIAAVLVFLVFCAMHIKTGSRLPLMLAAMFGGLAFMTRYIGIVTALVGAAALLQRHFHEENEHGRARLTANGLLFGVVFAAVSLPWLVRNYLMDGRIFGPGAPPSTETLSTNLLRTWDALLVRVPAVLAVLAAVLIVFLVKLFLRQRTLAIKSRIADPRVSLLWFAISYAIILITMSMRQQIDAIDTRLLSPIYPPLLILATATIYRLVKDHSGEAGAGAITSICALSVLLMVCIGTFSPQHGSRKGPLMREFGTVRPEATDWIMANTKPDSLLIGRGIWGFRFFTDRPVLECGYPCTPYLSKVGIDKFLVAHSNRYASVYLFADRNSDLDRAYSESAPAVQVHSWSVRKLVGQ